MKLTCIIVILSLSVIVEGAWWAIAVRPIILTLGAALTALNLDESPFLDLDLKGLFISKNDSGDGLDSDGRTWTTEDDFDFDNPLVDKEKFEVELGKLKELIKEIDATPEHILSEKE